MLNFGGVSLLFSARFCKHISTVYITIWHGFGYRFLWVPLSLWFGAIRHFGLSLWDYLHERKFWRNLIRIILVHPAIITWESTIETEQRKSSILLSHLVLLWYFLGPPQIVHAVLCQTILLPCQWEHPDAEFNLPLGQCQSFIAGQYLGTWYSESLSEHWKILQKKICKNKLEECSNGIILVGWIGSGKYCYWCWEPTPNRTHHWAKHAIQITTRNRPWMSRPNLPRLIHVFMWVDNPVSLHCAVWTQL